MPLKYWLQICLMFLVCLAAAIQIIASPKPGVEHFKWLVVSAILLINIIAATVIYKNSRHRS